MNRFRLFLVMIVGLLLAGTFTFTGGTTQADAGTRTFPETGKTVQGRFLEYWNQNGGLPQQGYPISEEMQEQSSTDGRTYTVQYFERAVFEKHPENAKPYDVLLSLLGVFYYDAKYKGGAPGQQTSTDNPRLFSATGKTVGGAFRTYWETHGGLAQQGYPISDEFAEVSATDGKTYTVQYFERAVFEKHPEKAAPYDVLLSLLGVSYYKERYGGGTITTPGAPTRTPTVVVPSTSPTATPVPPQPADNTGQVIFYNAQTGRSTIGHVDASGNYQDLKTYSTWQNGWDQIVPLGHGYTFFYLKSSGLTTLGHVATDGTYTDVASSFTLGAGWTHVVSAGNNLILYYKTGTGTGGSARVNPDGSITLLKVYTTFATPWTHIVGLDNGLIAFYAHGMTRAATVQLDNNGNVTSPKSYSDWSPNWTSLVPGPNGTLLKYFSADGNASVSQFDSAGNETVPYVYDSQTGEARLPSGYNIVTEMSNGTLLFYNGTAHQAITGSMGSDGSVTIFNPTGPKPFADWTQIVGIR